MTTTSIPSATAGDPIDVLVPPPRPWWVRLAVGSAVIVAVGALGYSWHFGLLRPSPDCCGSGSSGAQIGLSDHDGAVTVTAYFHNSSAHAVKVVGARAELPGGRVVEVAPFDGPGAFELPPENLAEYPFVVDGNSDAWLAVSFVPDRCSGDASDWGAVTLDLEVADDPWYPTFGRTFALPDALVPVGDNQLGVFAPARLDGAFTGSERPLAAACILLGH